MLKRGCALIIAIAALSLFAPAAASAQQAWITDILANPSRNWNKTVTLTGQVQTVEANPAGTTRGTYTLLDDSCPTPITVRSNDLPPAGKTFVVTGIVIQDPASTAPILKEVSRTTPGMSSTMLYLLIGAGVLFLALLAVFIILLTRTKQPAAAAGAEAARPRAQDAYQPPSRPVMPPPAAAPDPARTMKIPAAPVPDKTQVFLSLGADLVVEKGPDKGREFPLHKYVTMIGRSGARQNDIELTDDTVSKDQASVYYDGAGKTFSITNESGTNPTKINGQPISGPTLIENGTLIEMGRTVLRLKKN